MTRQMPQPERRRHRYRGRCVRGAELPGASAETRVIVQAPAGTELESGTRIGLAMPPERTYFFDAETGDARRSREHISL